MSAYWILYGKFTVLAVALWWLLRRAPARWRFRVALTALIIGAVPWQLVPRFDYANPVIADWIVSPTASPLSRPAFDPVAPEPNRPWPLLESATGLGVLAFAVIALQQRRRHRRWMRASTSMGQAQDLRGKSVPIRVLPGSDLAAISGVRNPVIWLGEQWLDHPQHDAVLRHELEHLAGNDHCWIWLIAALHCLLWWHPGTWVWAWVARREMEQSCDDRCGDRLGRDNYRLALAKLVMSKRSHRVHTMSLAMLGRQAFDIIRIKRLEENTMIKHWHRLAIILALVIAPLTLVNLRAEEAPPVGGTSVVEKDEGILVEFNQVPTSIALRTVADANGFSLHLHPSLRGRLGEANLRVEAPDWPDALAAVLNQLRLPFRLDGVRLIVAPTDQLQDLAWLTDSRSENAGPGRQILADVRIEYGGQTQSIKDLILTEDNWAGLKTETVRLNVKPVLLPDGLVQLEFLVSPTESEKGPTARPVLITRFDSDASLEMGSSDPDSEAKTLRIEVTPRRL